MTCTTWRRLAALPALVAAVAPTVSWAHHPMGGVTPQTFLHGILSGFGHPVLGPDHLAFIVGMSLMVAFSRRWLWLPAAFVTTLIPGVLTQFAGVGLGPNEIFVALSVVALGVAILYEARLPVSVLVAAVLAAGFLHGYAFGETIIGAEPTPLVAYLIGLSVMILALTTALSWLARLLFSHGATSARAQQIAAALLIVSGAVLTVQNLLG